MAAQPGEEVAVTLFADVHYFYGPPTSKPPHHRFDKRSYVYLYENASKRQLRLQIANNAGTDDQDAFDGFLDSSYIEYSYKQPSLVTLTVGGTQIEHSLASRNDTQWRLPTYDMKNENKYLYKLHTLDIYFWLKEDALSFLSTLRRILPETSFKVLDEPVAPPSHRDEMSPMVQKLENVAISDPSYHAQNSASTVSDGAPKEAAIKAEEQPAQFAPMAYNPAAPAAPETIRYREKTPPPDDGGVNPLAAATKDQGQPFSPGYQPNLGRVPSALGPPQGTPQSSYFPGPPQATGSPFNSQQLFGQQMSPPPQYSQQQTQYATYPGSPGFQQPVQSPGLQPLGSPSFAPPPTAAHAVPPPPPVGGYSSYSYSQNQGMAQANEYDVHNQVWRPTEGEHAHKHEGKKEPRGKLEASAGKLERGVTGFLKKVEKKYL